MKFYNKNKPFAIQLLQTFLISIVVFIFLVHILIALALIGVRLPMSKAEKEEHLIWNIETAQNRLDYFPENYNQNRESLIILTNQLHQDFPDDKTEALYNGIMYALDQKNAYDISFINHLGSLKINSYQQDYFIKGYCFTHPRKTHIILKQVKSLIDKSVLKPFCHIENYNTI